MLLQPQVIFIDAVGTLFGVQGSVGEIYSQFAAQAGVEVDAQQLNRAFIKSFLAAPRAAFAGVAIAEIPQQELAWWRAIAAASFSQVDALEQFGDFDAFFQPLFEHFATADPWFVYADVPKILAEWQAAGIAIGVLSNFDSRLHKVLQALDLAQFFSSVTISTAVGFAKPEPGIFAAALAEHDCPPQAAWHIGDSWHEDVGGAIAARVQPIWLNRHSQPLPENAAAVTIIHSFAELPKLKPSALKQLF
ncbi:MAG: HAD-IA family hydrolase [Aphanocapsa sp. GSE-SYN-MK-11-07L]|jgi:putative hydrolase of the HAD superfamily|nr:HAD-IA family hydrolase [Aphanocapsa sp. GSE-SYN-MK-11-07L]